MTVFSPRVQRGELRGKQQPESGGGGKHDEEKRQMSHTECSTGPRRVQLTSVRMRIPQWLILDGKAKKDAFRGWRNKLAKHLLQVDSEKSPFHVR